LPVASRTIVGTGAGFDLLPVDEALDLADDVGTARIIVRTPGITVGTARIIVRTAGIIVRTDGIIVHTDGIIVHTDGYVVRPRGNELSGRRNEGTDRGNDAGKAEDDLTGGRDTVSYVGGRRQGRQGLADEGVVQGGGSPTARKHGMETP